MAKSFKDFPPGVQTLVLVIVAVAVVGGLFYLEVYPLLGEKTKREQTLAALTKENEANRAFEQKLADYQARIKALTQQLETVRSIVPDEPSMDSFMKQVFADAGSTGNHVRTFIPQAERQQKYYVELPVRIRLDGNYWTMVNFFDRLAREQRIISVTSIDLGDPRGGGMGQYKVPPNETVGANCVLMTYYNQSAPATPAGKQQKKK
jgi:type IV pilus assembly protein PilO